MTTYFDLLPIELSEMIFQKKHKMEMKETLFYFIDNSPVNKLQENLFYINENMKCMCDDESINYPQEEDIQEYNLLNYYIILLEQLKIEEVLKKNWGCNIVRTR